MTVITRGDLESKAKCEALVEAALNDMGLGTVPERENGVELRGAAKSYYMSLIQDELDNSDDVLLTECFATEEVLTLGFVEGYEACLRSHGGK